MKNSTPRLLSADDIDCRVQSFSKNGDSCILLLYKDARVDQRVLDELYGPFGWKRSHELIGDRLYCTVSVYDDEKHEWVSKQDVGTESFTEPEKGQASDSFKRACFNWGIGRELYSAPRIRINLGTNEAVQNGKGQFVTYTTFHVTYISYDDNRNISGLAIADNKGVVRYTWGTTPAAKPATKRQATSNAEVPFVDGRKELTEELARDEKTIAYYATNWNPAEIPSLAMYVHNVSRVNATNKAITILANNIADYKVSHNLA